MVRMMLMGLSLVVLLPVQQVYAKRVALVIGNAAYQYEGALANPVNDAVLLEKTLKGIGFEVISAKNLSTRDMNRLISQFSQKSQRAEAAVVYFSGHGQQTEDKKNYLLAVDAKIEEAADLQTGAVSSDALIAATEGAKVRLVILDACRDRPQSVLKTKGASKGLSRARDPSSNGLLIAYATEDGQVAQDGRAGSNSPYARALATALQKQDKPILPMLDDVTDQVVSETKQKQHPTRSGSLRTDTFLVPPVKKPIPLPDNDTTKKRNPDVEIAFWDSIKTSQDPAQYAAYLRQYPEGNFKELARVLYDKYQPSNAASKSIYEEMKPTPADEEGSSTNKPIVLDLPKWISSLIKRPTDLLNATQLPKGLWSDSKRQVMWMRCSLGQTWQDGHCLGEPILYNWQDAQNAIQQLNQQDGFAGYTDWTLPHIEDLFFLIRCSTNYTSVYHVPNKTGTTTAYRAHCGGTDYLKPTIDQAVFAETSQHPYWSITASSAPANQAWVVSFGNGTVGAVSKHQKFYVRPVRVVETSSKK